MAPNDAATNLRIPTEALDRADALIPVLAEDPLLRAAGRGVTRALVLRLAVLRGLDVLETEFKTGKPSTRKASR